MTPILGITASSITSSFLSDFESIATVTVGSGGANEIEFTSIPSTYQHLQIRAITNTNLGYADNIYVRINGDTGSNYSYHGLWGDGASALAAAGASQSTFLISRIAGTGTNFSGFVADVLDYKDTNKYTTIRSLSGFDNNGSGQLWFWSGSWRNTNAITSIKISAQFGGAAVLNQYSHFALYGIKG